MGGGGDPGDGVGDSEDAQAMFRWFAETPAYRAGIGAVRAVHPGAWDLPAWLASGAWTLPAPARR